MDDNRGGVLSSPAVVRTVRWGVVAWSVIGVAILGYLAYRYVVHPIRVVFPPLLLALIVVYLLNPFVRGMERRGIPRLWGALITYVVFLTLVGIAVRFLAPIVAEQVTNFAGSVPALLERAQATFADLAARFRVDVDVERIFSAFGGEGGAAGLFERIRSATVGVFHVAVIFILGPILAFYFLVDLPKIQRGVSARVPVRRRAEVEAIFEKIGRALGGFFRGQLMVAVFVGLASMLGLWIVGLPYFAVVGLVAGLFNLIPLIGPFIGGIPALFIAFTTQSSGGLLSLEPGWPLAIGASLALLVVQQIDNHIISPNVVARTVKLHPVTVMLGLLIGGTTLGLWGMLLAVPVIATSKILLLYYWDTRMQWPPPGREEAVERAVERASEGEGAVAEAVGALGDRVTTGGPPPRGAPAEPPAPGTDGSRDDTPSPRADPRSAGWGLGRLFRRRRTPPAPDDGGPERPAPPPARPRAR